MSWKDDTWKVGKQKRYTIALRKPNKYGINGAYDKKEWWTI